MNEQEKHICFGNTLLEETNTFYEWSEGEIRITDKVLELITHKSERKCGRNSLWESGSHSPGRDQEVNGVSVSSKSAKLEDNNFKISSYRLTQCKTVEDFVNEIKKRDESFTKYLVCLTEEINDKHIVRWGFIEKDKANISNAEWEHTYKKDGTLTGLQSLDGKFKIVFSMSNQLWISFTLSDFDIICTYEYELKNTNAGE
jgi:hypothetical protein